jgi:hypothetical protein
MGFLSLNGLLSAPAMHLFEEISQPGARESD